MHLIERIYWKTNRKRMIVNFSCIRNHPLREDGLVDIFCIPLSTECGICCARNHITRPHLYSTPLHSHIVQTRVIFSSPLHTSSSTSIWQRFVVLNGNSLFLIKFWKYSHRNMLYWEIQNFSYFDKWKVWIIFSSRAYFT